MNRIAHALITWIDYIFHIFFACRFGCLSVCEWIPYYNKCQNSLMNYRQKSLVALAVELLFFAADDIALVSPHSHLAFHLADFKLTAWLAHLIRLPSFADDLTRQQQQQSQKDKQQKRRTTRKPTKLIIVLGTRHQNHLSIVVESWLTVWLVGWSNYREVRLTLHFRSFLPTVGSIFGVHGHADGTSQESVWSICPYWQLIVRPALARRYLLIWRTVITLWRCFWVVVVVVVLVIVHSPSQVKRCLCDHEVVL